MEYLDRGRELRGRSILPATLFRLSCTRAKTLESRREYEAALAELDEAERVRRPGAVPEAISIDALRARILVRHGSLVAAGRWLAGRRTLESVNPIPYLKEAECITSARVGISLASQSGDTREIDRWCGIAEGIATSADSAGRGGSALEALLVATNGRRLLGRSDRAADLLGTAVTLASEESIVQPVVDDGPDLEPILSRLLTTHPLGSFVRGILARIRQSAGKADEEGVNPDANQLLVEPLSPREREVLRLIERGHSNQAIADELFISLSTVKKHLNNLFGKLMVGRRTEALRKARDLGLL